MTEVFPRLRVSSPAKKYERAEDAQYLLSGHNRFSKTKLPIHTYHGKADKVWGEASGHAADRARYWLGYPKDKVNIGGVFGSQIYSYLVPLSSSAAKRLPAAYLARRKYRVAKELRRLKALESHGKTLALKDALTKVGVHESGFTNDNEFGRWFGFDRVPWCAEFVSWAFRGMFGGKMRTALARQFMYWAQSHTFGLSMTYNPEPGDIVVYDSGEGHVGIFKRWIIPHRLFEAVEGNTSCAGGSWNNGGEVCVQTRDFGKNPKFVRVP